ncbi:MAG: hypothetical protein V3S20_03455 [Dehalococcoidia bacterium]
MSEEFVLVVSDENDAKQGEVSVLDTDHEVERLVETLLESGIDQNRIRIFAGAEAGFETTYRPVVSLFDEPNETARLEHPVNAKEAVKAHIGNGPAQGGDRPSSVFRSTLDDEAIDVYTSASEAS